MMFGNIEILYFFKLKYYFLDQNSERFFKIVNIIASRAPNSDNSISRTRMIICMMFRRTWRNTERMFFANKFSWGIEDGLVQQRDGWQKAGLSIWAHIFS